jgi:hypothetical protein
VLDPDGTMIPGAPPEPDNLYDELDVDHLPGAAVVNALLDAGEIPRALFWFPITFLFLIAVAILVYRLSKSLFATCLTTGCLLIFVSRTGITPFWLAIPFFVLAVGILVKEKTVSLS